MSRLAGDTELMSESNAPSKKSFRLNFQGPLYGFCLSKFSHAHTLSRNLNPCYSLKISDFYYGLKIVKKFLYLRKKCYLCGAL